MAAPILKDFDETLNSITEKYDAYLRLKPRQKFVLKKLWDGEKSLLISLPTGYGKSLLYQLGGQLLAVKEKREKWVTVVLSPLNIIQRDQLAAIHKKNIPAVRVDMAGNVEFPDGSLKAMDAALQADMEDGMYQIIYFHPEALMSSDAGLSRLGSTKFLHMVGLLAIDECHTVDTWRQRFRTAFRKLDALPSYFKCPVVALSATLTTSMWTEVPKHLGMGKVVLVCENPDKTKFS